MEGKRLLEAARALARASEERPASAPASFVSVALIAVGDLILVLKTGRHRAEQIVHDAMKHALEPVLCEEIGGCVVKLRPVAAASASSADRRIWNSQSR